MTNHVQDLYSKQKFYTLVEWVAAGGQRRRREVAQQLEEQAARLPRPGGGSGGTRRDWQLRQREQRRQRRQPGRPSGNPLELESTVDCNLIHNGALKERPKGTFLFFSFLSVLVISWGSLKSSLAGSGRGRGEWPRPPLQRAFRRNPRSGGQPTLCAEPSCGSRGRGRKSRRHRVREARVAHFHVHGLQQKTIR